MYNFAKMIEDGFTEEDISEAIGFDYSKMKADGYTDEDISEAIGSQQQEQPVAEMPTDVEQKADGLTFDYSVPTKEISVAEGQYDPYNYIDKKTDVSIKILEQAKIDNPDMADVYDVGISKVLEERQNTYDKIHKEYNKKQEDLFKQQEFKAQEEAKAKVEETVAAANVVYQQGSLFDMVRDLGTELATDEEINDELNATHLAGQQLIKDGVLDSYDFVDKIGYTKEGYKIPLESSLMSELMARKYSTAGSIVGGTIGGTIGTVVGIPSLATPAAPAAPLIVFGGGKIGSAIGSGYGETLDVANVSKVFGKEVSSRQYVDYFATAANDDMLYGQIGEYIFKSGAYVTNKVKRFANHLTNDSIDQAWDYYKTITNKTPEQLEDLISTASELWGVSKPDLNTTAGKKQAFRFVAFYDDTIGSEMVTAASLTDKGKTNLVKNIINNANALGAKIKTNGYDGKDFVKDIYNIKQETEKLFSQTRGTYAFAFDNIELNYGAIGDTLQGNIEKLKSLSGVFDEKMTNKLNTVINKSSNLESIEDVLDFDKAYNSFLRDFKKNNGGVSNKEFKAIMKSKDDITKHISNLVNQHPTLSKTEKTNLLDSLLASKTAYKIGSQTLETDLYTSIVSRKGNAKANNKILDKIIESAKTENLDKGFSEATELLGLLTGKQRYDAESAIFDRIMQKNMLSDRKGTTVKAYDYEGILDGIKEINHIFTNPAIKDTVTTLKKYQTLISRDTASINLSGIPTKAAPAGGGLSKNITGSLHIAAVDRTMKKLQVMLPAILDEVGLSMVVSKLPVLGEWQKTSKLHSLELNLAKGLETATDIPSLLTNIVKQNDNLPTQTKNGIIGILRQYDVLNAEIQKLPMDERNAYYKAQQEAIKAEEERLTKKAIVPYGFEFDKGKFKPAQRARETWDTSIGNNRIDYEPPIDVPATRSYKQDSSGRIVDEYGNIYNSKEDFDSFNPSYHSSRKGRVETGLNKNKPDLPTKVTETINPNAYKQDIKRLKNKKKLEASKQAKQTRAEAEAKGQTEIDFSPTAEKLRKDAEDITTDINAFEPRNKVATMTIDGEEISKTKFDDFTNIAKKVNAGKDLTDKQRKTYKANTKIIDNMLDLDWSPHTKGGDGYPNISDYMNMKELAGAKSFAEGKTKSKTAEGYYQKWKKSQYEIEKQLEAMDSFGDVGF